MEERPYDQRPAARPAEPERPVTPYPNNPQTPLPKRRSGWVWWVVIAVIIMGGVAFFGSKSGGSASLLSSCKQAVADWHGSSVKEVTGSLKEETGTRQIYEGTFPGGDWACNGPKGSSVPYIVTVATPDIYENIVENMP